MTLHKEIRSLVWSYLRDPSAGWGLGSIGALGEFRFDPDEAVECRETEGGGEVCTKRGGLRVALSPSVSVAPYEVPSTRPGFWSHGVAFCLPEAAAFRQRRGVLTELGYDRDALRSADRDSILFDLGLGIGHIEVLVRVRDHTLLSTLGAARGRPFLDPANPALVAVLASSPHRVFRSSLGRIEVFGPIPGPEDKTPDSGPHSHILPDLLKAGRSHSANIAIPEGTVPCLSLFPANPVVDPSGKDQTAFDDKSHKAFQKILTRFGDAGRVALKQRVRDAIIEGKRPYNPADFDRFERHVVRVLLRQLSAEGLANADTLAPWASRFDPRGIEDLQNS